MKNKFLFWIKTIIIVLLCCVISNFIYLNINFNDAKLNNNKNYIVVGIPNNYLNENGLLQLQNKGIVNDLSIRVPKYKNTCTYDAWLTLITGTRALFVNSHDKQNRCIKQQNNRDIDNLSHGICTNDMYQKIKNYNSDYLITGDKLNFNTFLNNNYDIYTMGSGANLLQCAKLQYPNLYNSKLHVLNSIEQLNKNSNNRFLYIIDLMDSSDNSNNIAIDNILNLQKNNKKTAVLFVGLPNSNIINKQQSFNKILLLGTSNKYKNLYSQSTHRYLIQLSDVLSVSLKQSKIILSHNNYKLINNYNTTWNKDNINYFYMLILFIAILFLICFIRYSNIIFLFNNIILFLLSIPICTIITGILYQYIYLNTIQYIFILFLSCATMIYIFNRFINIKYHIVAICMLLYSIISVDIIMLNIFSLNTLFGIHLITGGRFYGLGNEMLSIYIVSIGFIVYYLNKYKVSRFIYILFSILTLCIMSFPNLGAKFGGTISVVPLLFWHYFLKTIKIQYMYFLYLLIAGLIFIISISALSQYFGILSNSHLTNFIHNIFNGKYQYIIYHKMALNINSYMYNNFNFMLIILLLGVLYYTYRTSYKIVYLISISLCLSVLLEDSGVDILKYAFILLIPIILYNLLIEITLYNKNIILHNKNDIYYSRAMY